MGVKQSKRSVDITETSTKGEIEGFGNEGKVEKIIDGVLEKVVAANGHVEGDLQNGIESLQNDVETMQNGEAAAVSVEKITEKNVDELPVDGAINGQIENGEVKAEAEKTEEAVKTDEKKEKKKKDKVVKKKFSFRNFSFSKKDKSKPPKEEKTPTKVQLTEMGAEEVPTSPEKEEITSIEKPVVETPPVLESTKLEVENAVVEEAKPEIETPSVVEKPAEISSKTVGGVEDLPPPLPASPPPSEPIEGKLVSALDKLDLSEPSSGNPSEEIDEVACSISSILTDKMEPMTEVIKNAEQIAMETGKQIEEKATNLLKTVEERAEESLRTAGELVSQEKVEEKETCCSELGGMTPEKTEAKEEMKIEEDNTRTNVEISNLDLLSKVEDPAEKHEEGAGESLADMPKDLTEEVTTASIEASNPENLEIPETIPPPPVVEAVTGE